MTIEVPQTFNAPQQVNTSTGIDNNNQVIQTLSDGTFVIVYQVSGVVHFQQYDQFGNTIGTEGTLVTPNIGAAPGVEILAVENNQLVLAYRTASAGIQVQSYSIIDGVGATTTDIFHDLAAPGLQSGNRGLALSGSSLADVAVHATLTGSGDVRELVTFTELDTATPQINQISTNFVGSALQEATLLENGNRVVVLDTDGQGTSPDTELTIHIMAPDGTEVATVLTNSGVNDTVAQPQITALVGGRFVVAMRTDDADTDLEYQVFEADGTPVNSVTLGAFNNGADQHNDPELVPLEDGGFLVMFDRDNDSGRMIVRRFDADGEPTAVDPNNPGSFSVVLTLDVGDSATSPVATLLDDGLVAISYVKEGAIQLAIVATQALDIVLTDADETITATSENDTVDAAGGDDNINAGAGDDFIIGGAGADTLNGGAGRDTISFETALEAVNADLDAGVGTAGDATGDEYSNIEVVIGSDFNDTLTIGSDQDVDGGIGDDVLTTVSTNATLVGGLGDDTLVVDLDGGFLSEAGAPALVLDGGDGIDTADFTTVGLSLIGDDLRIDLASGEMGTFASLSGGAIDGIENIIGSTEDDAILGDDIANRLDGNDGDDFISGRDGDDTLEGGDGNDRILGGTGNDTANGGDGRDSIEGAEGDDLLEGGLEGDEIFGGDGNDSIFGATQELPDATAIGDFLEGNAGNDFLHGSGGEDTLSGGTGDDTGMGGEGGDTINGDEGNDFIDGGDGDDVLTGDDGDEFSVHLDNDDTIEGGEGNDNIFGGNGEDQLFGDAGNDSIVGGEGDDFIEGGAGNDTILGDVGNSSTHSGSGADTIDGGDGDDSVRGGEDNDSLTGGLGADALSGDTGDDALFGNEGDDSLDGDSGSDTLDGGVGSDEVFGGEGDDTVIGGEGDDTLAGDDGNDELDGGAGIDELRGGAGDDTLSGGDGEDSLSGSTGRDLLFGGADDDQVFGDNGNDAVNGDDGDDFVRGGAGRDLVDGGAGNDTLRGDDDQDTLTGGDGDDVVNGDNGNDLIIAGFGADSINGGTGTDTVTYAASAASIDVELDTSATVFGFGVGGFAQDDVLVSIENVIGTAFNDRITGNVKDNVLNGGNGNDVLDGAEGADILVGGNGDDLLVGGTGDNQLFGGLGTDTARFIGDRSEFSLALEADGRLSVTDANDDVTLLASVEFLEFTNGAFTAADALLSTTPTAGDDRLTGTIADDALNGLGGADTLNGGNGNDSLDGGEGADILVGGNGDDLLIGGTGANQLFGGLGTDTAFFDADEDTFAFALEADSRLSVTDANGDVNLLASVEELVFADRTLTVDQALASRVPSAGDDFLTGTQVADQILGFGGNDTITGLEGADTLNGGNGNDSLDGGEGADILVGGNGDDLLIGGTGTNQLFGGLGTDTAIFDGDRDSFQFDLEADGRLSVTDAAGGVSLLASVELLAFTDGTVTANQTLLDTVLQVGVTETDDFGNKFNGQTDVDGLITAGFEGTGSDLELTFQGFDIDTNNEVELFLNGDSMGFLDAGVNNGLQSYEIDIAAADQVSGENVITFEQALDDAFAWGVTDLLIA